MEVSIDDNFLTAAINRGRMGVYHAERRPASTAVQGIVSDDDFFHAPGCKGGYKEGLF